MEGAAAARARAAGAEGRGEAPRPQRPRPARRAREGAQRGALGRARPRGRAAAAARGDERRVAHAAAGPARRRAARGADARGGVGRVLPGARDAGRDARHEPAAPPRAGVARRRGGLPLAAADARVLRLLRRRGLRDQEPRLLRGLEPLVKCAWTECAGCVL